MGSSSYMAGSIHSNVDLELTQVGGVCEREGLHRGRCDRQALCCAMGVCMQWQSVAAAGAGSVPGGMTAQKARVDVVT